MKLHGPITMLHFSISQRAFVDQPHNRCLGGTSGPRVAVCVDWSEKHGDSETLVSALWMQIAPDIWVDMSQKK